MDRVAVGRSRAAVILVLLVAWGAAHVALWGPYGLFFLSFEFALAVFVMLATTIGRSMRRRCRSAT